MTQRKPSTSLHAVGQRWLTTRHSMSPTSLDSYRSTLRVFERYIGSRRPIASIERHDIDAWITSMVEAEAAQATIYNRFSCVRVLFAWCVDEGLIAASPADKIQVKTPGIGPPRSLDEHTIGLVMAAAPARTRLMIILATQLGLRRAEIAGLEMRNLNLTSKKLIVKGKGRKERELHLPKQAHEGLSEWVESQGLKGDDFVFADRTGERPVTPKRVGILFLQASRRAGVHATPHMFRHSAATDVLTRTGNVKLVQDMLGHASMGTTTRYLKTVDGVMRDGMEGRTYGATEATE